MATETPTPTKEMPSARRIRRLRKTAEVILPAAIVGMIGYFSLSALDAYPGVANFAIGLYWGIVGEFFWEIGTDNREKKPKRNRQVGN